MKKKVLLMILDGWGIGKKNNTNAIYTTGTPKIDALQKQYPHSELLTCGENVGLPDGQMGNSEVGHLNIGAGRIVYQDLVKINRACRDNSIVENTEVKKAYTYAKQNNKNVHLLGLVSDGGVHSSLEHLKKLCDISKTYGVAQHTYVHCFMDGRDTDPKSGKNYIAELLDHLSKTGGEIASIIGRYYAMDRDKRWERVKVAYDLMVHKTGKKVQNPLLAIEESYQENITDEFIHPITLGNGKIQEGDVVIFFNFRNDRAKELTTVLSQQKLYQKVLTDTLQNEKVPSEAKAALQTTTPLPLYFCSITPYDDKFENIHILFDKDNVQETLGEIVAKAGIKQLRIAETEKYAHVTFFFSGGREEVFADEERILIPSPKVATYDLQPAMSAVEVKNAICVELQKQKYGFIALNFANGDMVGHTGVYQAICEAVKTIDTCVDEVVKTAISNDYTVLITADHGNADNALNEDGSPNTAHSLNPVPFIVVDKDIKQVQNGVLADIAPTILSLMEISIPKAMTGKVLTK